MPCRSRGDVLEKDNITGLLKPLLAARPRFAFLGKPGTALTAELIGRVLALLRDRSISHVTFQEGDGHPEWYDLVLEPEDNGLWTCSPKEDGRVVGNPCGSRRVIKDFAAQMGRADRLAKWGL